MPNIANIMNAVAANDRAATSLHDRVYSTISDAIDDGRTSVNINIDSCQKSHLKVIKDALKEKGYTIEANAIFNGHSLNSVLIVSWAGE